MRTALLACFAAAAISFNVQAQWKVVGSNGERGKDRNTARVESRDGHALSIYREANGSVWASFSIPPRDAAEIHADHAPTLQVDAFPVRDAGIALRLQRTGPGIQAYNREPKRVSFLVAMGSEHELHNETLTQLMEGRNVLVRYATAGGESRHVSFTLNAARPAIAHALDIPMRNDAALMEHRAKFEVALRGAMQRCARAGQDAKACADRALACSRQAGSHDLRAYRECVK